ncbi:MAG: tRNA (N(6)-L-threonylcarbamoyladenosine(37)-C(2))-methylthiotransferase MtaB [Desulfuromonadales bacterium]|nr:tRNA (N(6)-L-threonylcarbamoyladenosine(37)-C(2))-methylthiotransferase MtaB [Desulfuromonadales bacterium]MBN2793468.1 tRNA (N(6)-L-threonylcarbamoyladenosine(37)-C(2))-methylthiotransferase MtaB [Desulfuromonadales bacterium]
MTATYAIVTLGCKTNQFESAAMGEQLQYAGYRPVDFSSGADLVIVNTCTVTAATDAQSRNLIRRAKRFNPASRIIVTGCYAQIDPQSLKRLPGVTLVLGNREKTELLKHLHAAKSNAMIRVSDIREQHSIEPLSLTGFEQRSRAFVQIQNGCDAFCSYCIIPYARGRSRSVPINAVVRQIEELSTNGYPEVVLTGIHIGQYGLDLDPSTNLLTLLQEIEKSDFQGRLRLGSIEPTELSLDLLDYVADSSWICPHLHIPLQAGSNRVLERMNRHYKTAFYRNLLLAIRQRHADAAIGLDIIAGFPGETDKDFIETLELLDELPFTHMHVFPYSRRPGTPAAEMSGQLPGDVIKSRAARLRQVGTDKLTAYSNSFIGRILNVVVEGKVSNNLKKGLSEFYLPVNFEADEGVAGTLIPVTIAEANGETLKGKIYVSS